MKTIKIAITDDQILFRKGLVAILEKEPDFEFIFEANNGRELLELLESNDPKPEVLLLDLSMPEINGVDAMKVIHEKYPEIKVLILSVYGQNQFVSHLIDLGICGYLFKNTEPDEVKKAIREVMVKELFFNEALVKALSKRVADKKSKLFIQDNILTLLSPRELEVLNLICEQKTAQEIAEILFISVRTVDGHRNNLLEKTGARNTAGLVVYAIKNELVDPQILMK